MTQNDWFSLENHSLFLCSLAVISLRIPWAEPSLPPFNESKYEPMPEVEIDPQDEQKQDEL